MNVAARAVVALVVAAGVTGAGHAVTAPTVPVLGPEATTVVVDVEHSTFRPSRLRVAAGTPVRFVVVNNDPIRHELIVGPAEVHARHRGGREEEHPPVPGEVSVQPGERGVTTYRFDDPGTVVFACHLPGHLDYGMRGEVEVVTAG